ncbi:MAG: DUF3726 domain-containing protein [Acidiferrobacterales bacterium]|nr:DUF3726 domain-containing protein [Acidiferrobacterales bacterium]
MRYSLNQIEHTVRKAVRGSGLSWGVAEDAGRAARWLHMVDFPGVTLVASVLSQFDHGAEESQKVATTNISRTEGGEIMALQPMNERLSPLVVGPCIGDWANALGIEPLASSQDIAIENVACPLVLVGYCGVAAQQTQLAFSLHWQGFQMRCTASELRYMGEKMESHFENQIKISSEMTNHQHPCKNDKVRTTRIGSVVVDSSAWKQLELLSYQTYVEATDSSRLSGAGAGLNDND